MARPATVSDGTTAVAAKINEIIADLLSQTDTSAQALASDVTIVFGKKFVHHQLAINNCPADARHLNFIPTVDNTAIMIRAMPKGTPADNLKAGFQVLYTDFEADATNYECLEMIFENVAATPTAYLNSFKGGTGTVRDLVLSCQSLEGLRIQYNAGKPAPRVPTYTEATKPAAAVAGAGAIIFSTDGGAGNVFQGSTGAAWVSLG